MPVSPDDVQKRLDQDYEERAQAVDNSISGYIKENEAQPSYSFTNAGLGMNEPLKVWRLVEDMYIKLGWETTLNENAGEAELLLRLPEDDEE